MPPGESARSRTATTPASFEGCRHGGDGEGPERHELQQPGRLAFVPQVVDDVLDRAGRGAERDDRTCGVLQLVLLERPEPSSRQLLEVGGDLVHDVESGVERCRLLAAQLEVVVGHREGPLRRGVSRVEHGVRDVVLADEARHLAVGKQRDWLGRVSDREAVEAHQHGQQDARIFGDARCHNHQVVGLLRILGEELNDTGVAYEHRVRVVAVDVDRPRERAVAERHDDRRTHRRGDVDDLGHQCQPLGRGRSHRSPARERSADRSAHRGVLRLDVDDLGACLPVGDELREGLDDGCLRCDRVDGHDVGVDLAHRVSDRLAAREQPEFGHSATISMAWKGQMSAQIPQPLQVSRSNPSNASPESVTAESGQ